jgi:hypothetical protein
MQEDPPKETLDNYARVFLYFAWRCVKPNIQVSLDKLKRQPLDYVVCNTSAVPVCDRSSTIGR